MLLPIDQFNRIEKYNEFMDFVLFVKSLSLDCCKDTLSHILNNDLIQSHSRMFYALVCRLKLSANSFAIISPTIDMFIIGTMLGTRDEFVDHFSEDHVAVILNDSELLYNFNSLVVFHDYFNTSVDEIRNAGIRILKELNHDYICEGCYNNWLKIVK